MFLWLLATIFLVSSVSAAIFVEPLNEVYNYGDQLSVQTNLISSAPASAHYIVDLVCGTNLTINIFNQFFNLPANVEQPVQVTTMLSNSILNNITSLCNLRASFNGETSYSNNFRISRLIELDLDLDFDELTPGGSFFVSGGAIKESGIPVNGFVEVFVNSLNLYKSATVSNGLLNLTIFVPENAKSGSHNLTVVVSDTSFSGLKLNEGSFGDLIKVSQTMRDIDFVMDKESIQPGSDFIFKIEAYDQAGDLMRRDVNLLVSDSKGIPFIRKLIKANEDQKISFYLNQTPGYWSLEASVDGLTKRKLFYLQEVYKIQTSLINDSLLVTNIGNADYEGPLEVTIGTFVEVKRLSLGSGESKKFKLEAPDGTYSISINDGSEPQVIGNTFLTGNAVRVADLREDLIDTVSNPIIWWLAAILFVLIIVLVQLKIRMQRRPPAPVSKPTEIAVKRIPVDSSVPQRQSMSVSEPFNGRSSTLLGISKPNPLMPASNVFAQSQSGARENAVVLVLRVSNGVTANASQTVNGALSLAQESGAKIYIDGEYKIALFSPRITRTYDNEVTAIQAAKRMESLLLDHNKVYQDKLMFGLGITSGEIISEFENGKFHFTTVGNVISAAKRIAQSALMKILISDSVRRKVMSTVKTEQSNVQGVWEIVRVVDRSSNNDFIRRFQARN